jgi:hypothetical protein
MQAQLQRPVTDAIAADVGCNGRQMARHEIMNEIEDEERDEKCLCRLARQNGQCGIDEPSIHVGQSGFDAECSDHPVLPLRFVDQGVFPCQDRCFGVPAKFHHERIARAVGLTDFDGTDVGEPEDSIELEFQLSFVERPQTVSQAVEIALADLGQAQLEGRDVAAVVDVELNRGEDEGDGAAEEENAGEQTRANAVARDERP